MITPDRCPGVLRLHEAGDGLLARIRVPGGRLSADALAAIATATELGNGLAELTSRGNVQVRGLHEGAEPGLVRLLAGVGLLPSRTHERVRNVLASPFAGRHQSSFAETDSVVAELDRGLCADGALAELSGRFLFAVDDGAALAFAPLADVTVQAEPGGGFRLWLDHRATALKSSRNDAAGLGLDAARAFMALAGDGARRIRDLEGGPARVARALGTSLAALRPSDVRVCLGVLVQRDGRHAVTGLPPLGRLDTRQLRELSKLGELRLSSSRTLTLLDVASDELAAARAVFEEAGLVLRPGSGWEGLSACSGAGACANAQFDVRAAASIRARQRAADAPAEHWSACGRRCGQRAPQPIAVVGDGRELAVMRGDAVDRVSDVAAALAVLA